MEYLSFKVFWFSISLKNLKNNENNCSFHSNTSFSACASYFSGEEDNNFTLAFNTNWWNGYFNMSGFDFPNSDGNIKTLSYTSSNLVSSVLIYLIREKCTLIDSYDILIWNNDTADFHEGEHEDSKISHIQLFPPLPVIWVSPWLGEEGKCCNTEICKI